MKGFDLRKVEIEGRSKEEVDSFLNNREVNIAGLMMDKEGRVFKVHIRGKLVQTFGAADPYPEPGVVGVTALRDHEPACSYTIDIIPSDTATKKGIRELTGCGEADCKNCNGYVPGAWEF